MKKIIDIDENGNVLGAPDFKTKYEELCAKLDSELFDKMEEMADKKIDEVESRNSNGKSPSYSNVFRFSKNELNPILTPMMVTSRLNRYLRMFRPLTVEEARLVDDSTYLEGFGYYCDLISYINDYLVYLPDKQTFCAFVNITTDTYNELLNDPNHSQVFHSIEDSFVQSNFSSAQAGIVNTTATLAKLQTRDAGHNLIKNPSVISVNQYNVLDESKINKKLEQFNSIVNSIEHKKR